MKKSRLHSFFNILLSLLIGFGPTLSHAQVYDVSGPDGRDDRDGTSHNGQAGTAQDGRNGGDAEVLRDSTGRLLKKGYDAGDLNLTLSVVEGDALKVKVDGQSRAPEVTSQNVVRDMIPLDSSLALRFRAKGGAGGRGGNGGRGEDGGKGTRGSHATRYSSGGSGGTGGDGGDEGDSTDGGEAGAGGKIVLRVGIRDNDLAMLFDEVNVEGNRGGRKGVGQGAGSGGPGGDGGSPYSWTEEESYTDTESYTDSDGNMQTRTVTKSRTTYHSNPGGSDGSSGSSGRRSSKQVRDGRDSQPGKFTYEIVDEDGKVRQYDGAYDLTLLPNFELVGSHNNNGFFEPGETIAIKNITVVNSGQAPTPKYQKIKLFMSTSKGWITSDNVELTLPNVLNPGDQHTFSTEHITFHLKEKERKAKGMLREDDVVAPQSRVTRVEREFRRFNDHSARKIDVQYPVRITPLDSLLTLAPGEVAKVLFKVKNISEQTIGKMSGVDARRAHTILRRTGGDVQDDSFVLVEAQNTDASEPEKGLLRALEGLKPGEERIISTLVGFKSNARAYTEAVIQPELFLESILDPSAVKLAQFEPFTLRVADKFEYSKDADVLLVANHTLDEKTLEALRVSTSLKQIKMDIWDFSYYGFFSFSHKLSDYETLFDAYRGKTIVILGNDVETAAGKTRVAKLLPPDAIIEAARRFGIKVVVLDTSGQSEKNLQDMTEPGSPNPEDVPLDQLREYANVNAFLKDATTSIKEVQEDQGNSESYLGLHQMKLVKRKFLWGTPDSSPLVKTGNRALQRLQRSMPEGQFYVDYRFKPVRAGRALWLFARWDYGDLSFRRSVDVTKTSVVVVPVSERNMNNPSFILSEEFQTAFNMGLNFATKLRILNSILLGDFTRGQQKVDLPDDLKNLRPPEPMAYAKLLVNSLLLDMVHEQIAIRPSYFSSKVKKAELWDKLDLLKKLMHHDYTQFKLDPKSDEGRVLVDMLVNLGLFSKLSLSYWDRMVPTKNRDVTNATMQMMERMISTVFSDAAQAKALIEENLAAELKIARKAKVRRSEQGPMGYLLGRIGALAGVESLRPQPVTPDQLASRVRDEDRQAELRSAEASRAKRAVEIRDGTSAKNQEMKLSAEDCATLLGKIGP